MTTIFGLVFFACAIIWALRIETNLNQIRELLQKIEHNTNKEKK